MTIEVVEAGLLTSVQDAVGRPAARRFGVPAGGALDSFSARLANRLVGNPDAAALLEATLHGPTLRFDRSTLIAISGADLGATLDGRPLQPGTARRGTDLRFGEPHFGARAYLAVAGGVAVPVVLGSRSTDLRSGFGGFEGRALRTGDVLQHGAAMGTGGRLILTPPTGVIRVLPGPHGTDEALDQLCGNAWTVSVRADRMGYRLDGEPLAFSGPAEVPSMGLPLGAVQRPPDGRPIVMLADRPVTGGYPVIACVIRADVGHVAQLLPGEPARFVLTTVDVAREALRAQERLLASVQADDGDDSAWAGALE